MSEPGKIRLFFEPADEQGVCSMTAELTNVSTGRRGEGRLVVGFYGEDGQSLHEGALALDPLLPGRVSAKNLPVPVLCSSIVRVTIDTAQWYPYPSVEVEDPAVYVIGGVAGTSWRLRFDPAQNLFVGETSID